MENKNYDHDLDWYKHEYYAECDRAEKLEKALDKACETLEHSVVTKVHEHDEFGEFDYEIPQRTKEEWYKELMKDE